MIFVIFLYAGFLTFTNVKHDAFNDEMNAVSTQWTMQDGSRVDIQNLPKLNDKWDSYVLSNTLPKNIKEGDSLNFYSYNSSFKVEINGRKVYHYTVKENITGHCDGDVIHSIGLSANDSGGEIVITATPIYRDTSIGMFYSMYVCGAQEYVRSQFESIGFSFMLSVIIIFIGISIMTAYLLMKYVGDHNSRYDLFSAAIECLLLGIWTLIDSKIPLLVLSDSVTLRFLDYAILPLCTYPIVAFINSMLE